MPEVYALSGVGNSGKTTTLRIVKEELLKKYPNAVVKDLAPKNKIVINGVKKRVVIVSRGDAEVYMEIDFSHIVSIELCDVIFCACRSKGGSLKFVKHLASPNQVHIIKKQKDASSDAANGTFIKVPLSDSDFSRLTQNSDDYKHVWTLDEIIQYFVGIGFDSTTASNTAAWLTSTVEHGEVLARNNPYIYMIVK